MFSFYSYGHRDVGRGVEPYLDHPHALPRQRHAGDKHSRECGYRTELDMKTPVATRGRDFPIARLAERLRCPKCGCGEISVMFGLRPAGSAPARAWITKHSLKRTERRSLHDVGLCDPRRRGSLQARHRPYFVSECSCTWMYPFRIAVIIVRRR